MVYFVITLLIFIIYKSVYGIFPLEAIKFLPLALLTIGIYRCALFKKHKIYVGKVYNARSIAVYMAFLIVFSVSILRKSTDGATIVGNINQSLQYCLLAFFTYSFFNYQFNRRQALPFEDFARRMIITLMIAPSLFVMLDTVFYSFGLTGEKTDLEGHKSVLSSLLGMDLNRTHFFLGGHHNNFAMTVGGLVALSIITLILKSYKGKAKLFLIATLFIGVFCLLLADVRGVFVAIIISLFAVLISKKMKVSSVLPFFVFLPLVFTLLTAPLLSLLSKLDHQILTEFSRSPGELLTFNNRIYIWEACIEEMKDFKPVHLLGYGQVGHAASGLQDEWEWILPGRVTHNVYLQSFLDFGYIGLFLLMATVFVSIRDAIWLYRRGLKEALILISFPVYFCFSGFSEVSIGLYNHPFTAIFLLFSFIPILLKNMYMQKLQLEGVHSLDYSSVRKAEVNSTTVVD